MHFNSKGQPLIRKKSYYTGNIYLIWVQLWYENTYSNIQHFYTIFPNYYSFKEVFHKFIHFFSTQNELHRFTNDSLELHSILLKFSHFDLILLLKMLWNHHIHHTIPPWTVLLIFLEDAYLFYTQPCHKHLLKPDNQFSSTILRFIVAFVRNQYTHTQMIRVAADLCRHIYTDIYVWNNIHFYSFYIGF